MNRALVMSLPNGGWTQNTYFDGDLTTNPIQLPNTKTEKLVDSQNNKGTVIHYFDGLYRETKKETFDSQQGGHIFVDTQYDGKGRKQQTSNPYRSGETVAWSQVQYDVVDRPIAATGPDLSTIQYSYTGNQTTVTDEGGNPRRYTYDGLGRMTKVEEPNPTLASPLITTSVTT